MPSLYIPRGYLLIGAADLDVDRFEALKASNRQMPVELRLVLGDAILKRFVDKKRDVYLGFVRSIETLDNGMFCYQVLYNDKKKTWEDIEEVEGLYYNLLYKKYLKNDPALTNVNVFDRMEELLLPAIAAPVLMAAPMAPVAAPVAAAVAAAADAAADVCPIELDDIDMNDFLVNGLPSPLSPNMAKIFEDFDFREPLPPNTP